MKCPKCSANIGIHYQELPLNALSDAFGVHCYICGFWKQLIPGADRKARA
ncbi:hypothetical protein [Geobacter pickeringii]|nr:hypothetical protein [Geobacter pickeringii]